MNKKNEVDIEITEIISENNPTKIDKAVSTIGDLATKGGITYLSTAIGFGVAGPVGAAGGAVLGSVCEKTLGIVNNAFSEYEKGKMGLAMLFLKDGIEKRIINGESLRSDIQDVDSWMEIWDANILRAKETYEKRKLKYRSKLVENLHFNEDMTFEEAFSIMSTIDKITYRQLQIISFIGSLNEDDRRDFQRSFAEFEKSPEKLPDYGHVLLGDVYNLFNIGIVAFKNEHQNGFTSINDCYQIQGPGLTLYPLGVKIYSELGLSDMSDKELEPFTKFFMGYFDGYS